ncbi:MAG: ABC transporter ATP-binding protein [Bacillota bacterium]
MMAPGAGERVRAAQGCHTGSAHPGSEFSVAEVLSVQDLRKWFPVASDLFGRPRVWVRAVDGVTLSIRRGETLGLVGESGCGKSTLGQVVVGLEPPTSGCVLLGQVLSGSAGVTREVRRKVQIVFQDPQASLDPRMTVEAIVGEPLYVAGWRGQRLRERVVELLGMVGLGAETLGRYPHEFSGGQRQRIAIARALALEPELLVLDEPTSALDVSVQAQVLNLLKELQKKLGLAYLFISHNMSVVRYMSDRVAVMYLGKVVEVGPCRVVLAAPQHPYTRALMRAVPTVTGGTAWLQTPLLEGDVPSPTRPPAGCRFHPRCARATDRCAKEEPILAPVPCGPGRTTVDADGHLVACHLAGGCDSMARGETCFVPH